MPSAISHQLFAISHQPLALLCEESHADDYLADDFEYLYDDGLVWALEVQGVALVDGDWRELGDRLRGILFSGAGESDRALSVFGGAVEDDPGGDHAGGVLRVFRLVSEGAAEVELSGRLRSDGRGGVRDFQRVVRETKS